VIVYLREGDELYIKPKNAKEIERAIFFLVSKYNETGNNSKPVILHSVKTAFYLLNKEYGKDIIIVALLHDLIEDSNTSKSEIKKQFGPKIADVVSALSFNSDIKDKKDRYMDMFKRTVSCGNEATIVKCADIYDNSFYIKLIDDEKLKKYLIDKIKCFLEVSQELIKDEPVWKDLNNRYLKLTKI
jgi:(p)ppGpp synthase/HD superfamily hydrolase